MIIHGSADTAVRPHGSQLFFDRVGSRDKTLKMYEGAHHDPLHDIGGDLVMSDLLQWLNARVTGRREAARQ